jgi:ADP-heptose:LPS heptosyltransferase
MLSTLGLTREDVTKPVVKIPVSEKKEVTKIAEKIQLNTDKFVIIAPEASTSNLLPISFWRTLVKELYSRGYDVFINATKLNEIKAKTHTLSYTELFLLSSMAKGVISLRSGVSEFLIPSKAKNITLAPRFHWSPALTAEQCIRAYSVMKLPFIDTNQVHEINPELYLSEDNLVKEIINLL